jgi:hypothetical protein
MPTTVASALASFELPDDAGMVVRLGSLWASRPAVVAFLRHYG